MRPQLGPSSSDAPEPGPAAPLFFGVLQSFEHAAAPPEASLMRRFDSKFLLTVPQALSLLERLRESYQLLPAGAITCARYETLYFDTPELRCYADHLRGRRSRFKVRIRHYPDRAVSFLEVKEKTNREQTRKHRQPKALGELELDEADRAFIRAAAPLEPEGLIPTLETAFRRVTLLRQEAGERVTLDLDLHFRRAGRQTDVLSVVIVEVKQPRASLQTPVIRDLRRMALGRCSFSKYCTGVDLLGEGVGAGYVGPILRRLRRLGHV